MPYLKRESPCPEPLDCRILTAALDLFVAKGYHNVSIHEIQKQADVSIGSIYKYFGGKQGVAKGLYEHLLNEMDELVDDVLEIESSPSEQCKQIIKLLFAYTDTHSNIIAFIFHTKHADFLYEEEIMFNSSPFVKIENIVKQGMEVGEFKSIDSWVAISCLFGSTTKMIQLRLDGVLDKPLIEYYESVISAVWDSLKV